MNTTIKKSSFMSTKDQADNCRQSEYFISFPWETDNQILGRFAKESITTFEGLANTIVNYWINFGVTSLLRVGSYPPGLEQFALIQFEDHSPKLLIMEQLSDRSHSATILQLDEMKHNISQTLKAFEHSKDLQEMWAKIQFPNTDPASAQL